MAKDKKTKANGVAPGLEAHPLRQVGADLAKANEKQAKAPRMQLGFRTRDTLEEEQQIELPCPMSSAELAHAGGEVARQKGEIEGRQAALAERKANERKAWKDEAKEIATLETEHSKTAREVREKAKYRVTPVRVEHDFGLGCSRFYRLDRGMELIGELYDTQPMDPERRDKMRKDAAKLAPKDEDLPVVPAPPDVDEATS